MYTSSPPDRTDVTAGRPFQRWIVGSGTVLLGVVLAILVAACAAPAEDGVSTSDAVDSPSAAVADDTGIPDVSLTTFEGETTDLRDLVGTPMVVNFWASWCPPCAAEMPDFQSVSQELGEDVRFVGINTSDDEGLADDLAERTGVTYDLLRDPDGQAFQAFGGFGMPTTVFVAADGTVQQTHTGFLTREALVGEIERWLDVAMPS